MKTDRKVPGGYVRLSFDLRVITMTRFSSAWFYSHWDPDVRGGVPSCGEADYLPTHGAKQH